jgi:hypothetical protein
MPARLPTRNPTIGQRKEFQPNVVPIPKNSPTNTQLTKERGVSAGFVKFFIPKKRGPRIMNAANHMPEIATDSHWLDVPIKGIVPKSEWRIPQESRSPQ